MAYNYLHLTFVALNSSGCNRLEWLYDASGKKVQQKSYNKGALVETIDYLDGIEYKKLLTGSAALEAIYHEEGRYLQATQKYEFIIKDHLGNIRLSFIDSDNNGSISISPTTEITQESYYYAFGMTMQGPWLNNNTYNYQYTNKELTLDIGLRLYDYGARRYDPIIGRWLSIDPLAENNLGVSEFSFSGNNPILFIDPDGMDWYYYNEDGSLNRRVKAEGEDHYYTGAENEDGNFDVSRELDYAPKDPSKRVQLGTFMGIPGQINAEQSAGGAFSDAAQNLLFTLAGLAGGGEEIAALGVSRFAFWLKLAKLRKLSKLVNVDEAVWAQKTFAKKFSGGKFAGQTVESVSSALRSGSISAADVPIDVIVRNGKTFILNTRSSAALTQASIPRSAWNVVNRTGQDKFEGMLTKQLLKLGIPNGTNIIKSGSTILTH